MSGKFRDVTSGRVNSRGLQALLPLLALLERLALLALAEDENN